MSRIASVRATALRCERCSSTRRPAGLAVLLDTGRASTIGPPAARARAARTTRAHSVIVGTAAIVVPQSVRRGFGCLQHSGGAAHARFAGCRCARARDRRRVERHESLRTVFADTAAGPRSGDRRSRRCWPQTDQNRGHRCRRQRRSAELRGTRLRSDCADADQGRAASGFRRRTCSCRRVHHVALTVARWSVGSGPDDRIRGASSGAAPGWDAFRCSTRITACGSVRFSVRRTTPTASPSASARLLAATLDRAAGVASICPQTGRVRRPVVIAVDRSDSRIDADRTCRVARICAQTRCEHVHGVAHRAGRAAASPGSAPTTSRSARRSPVAPTVELSHWSACSSALGVAHAGRRRQAIRRRCSTPCARPIWTRSPMRMCRSNGWSRCSIRPDPAAHHPLFQVMLVACTTRCRRRCSCPNEGRCDEVDPGIAKFDLQFTLDRVAHAPAVTADGIELSAELRDGPVRCGTAQRFGERFVRLLDAGCRARHRAVGDLDILDAQGQLSACPRCTVRDRGACATFRSCSPPRSAVDPGYTRCASVKPRCPTATRPATNQLARVLIGLGVGPETSWHWAFRARSSRC